jgi:hypothetical protein
MYSDSKEWYLDAYVSPSFRENEGIQWKGVQENNRESKFQVSSFKQNNWKPRNLKLKTL